MKTIPLRPTRARIMFVVIATLVLGTVMTGAGVAAELSPGYVYDGNGVVLRDGSGQCITTEKWTRENAIAECHPEIVAAREGGPQQVVMRRISLEADTFFEFDSATLTAEGKRRLDEIIGAMRGRVQDVQLSVTGYTDRIGSEQYNQQLSEDRAAAVRNYFAANGVPPDLIQVAGKGASDPVVSCEGMRGQELVECLAPNRRTEIEFSAFEEVEVTE